jgi:hypothetical protein
MPYGFIGTPAETYLTSINDAIEEAITAHKVNPISPRSTIVVPAPALPARINVNIPHPTNTAHSGGFSVGQGANNIVVEDDAYHHIQQDINEVDDEIMASMYKAAGEIAELCETSFVLPQTSAESKIVAFGVKNVSDEFRDFTHDLTANIRSFVSAIMGIG